MTVLSRKLMLVGGMLLALNACAGQSTAPERTASLNGQAVTLENQQQRCVLKRADQSLLPLDLPWPCQFSVEKDGRSHVEIFRSVPIVKVLHVAADPDKPLNCRTQSRAVRLIDGRLELSPPSRSAACATGVGDQKSYSGVFDW